ncbi:tail fiber assembly protein [Pseudomonas sp. TH08]|uniref:tail fiber assembly protein n=1 Tax=unclassified Pseudomonas TaxID=196821 RepID=UPI0019132BA5|nr:MULTISPECIES: tail fiber assembly protein [unclassified Pseudomonas]MBK5525407.1 tail fiber assembly protein [Pseudomonas sp. TH06]MBK5535980.1 tail fiber assembly protein [Pseudomonas sp. TH08]
MNRYALMELISGYSFYLVSQIVEAESNPPLPGQSGGMDYWMDVTANPAAQVGLIYKYLGSEPVFVQPVYGDYVAIAVSRKKQRFETAASWLTYNPMQYRVELGAASQAEVAQWQAYKQYIVDLSEINDQPGYPTALNWPTAPF